MWGSFYLTSDYSLHPTLGKNITQCSGSPAGGPGDGGGGGGGRRLREAVTLKVKKTPSSSDPYFAAFDVWGLTWCVWKNHCQVSGRKKNKKMVARLMK